MENDGVVLRDDPKANVGPGNARHIDTENILLFLLVNVLDGQCEHIEIRSADCGTCGKQECFTEMYVGNPGLM